ncbi:MAG: hypothetical protein WDO06_04955 [Actinomycetota bacterium]
MLQLGTKTTLAVIERIIAKYDLDSLEPIPFDGGLLVNDLGVVQIRLAQQIPVDRYADLPRTGSFLLPQSI